MRNILEVRRVRGGELFAVYVNEEFQGCWELDVACRVANSYRNW